MDSNLEREHAKFRQSAFDCVCKLQDVHAEKQYELIELVRALDSMLDCINDEITVVVVVLVIAVVVVILVAVVVVVVLVAVV